MSGCETHPCDSQGYGCAYVNYSTFCTVCPKGKAGINRQTCDTCKPGKGPNNADLGATACTNCSIGRYSVFGVCMDCAADSYAPKTGASACARCDLSGARGSARSNYRRTACECVHPLYYNTSRVRLKCMREGGKFAEDEWDEDGSMQPCSAFKAVVTDTLCVGWSRPSRVNDTKPQLLPGFGMSKAAFSLVAGDTLLHASASAKRGAIAIFKCPREQACVNDGGGLSPKCEAGTEGPLCSHCRPGFSRAGLKGACFDCDGDSRPTLQVLLMLALLVALTFGIHRFLWGDRPVDHLVQVVLSFGSRDGGFDYACDLKTAIVDAVGWQRSAVYVDADALQGKAGTQTTDFEDQDGVTRHSHLNPSWATYYKAAMEESPAMVFILSEAWCKSTWCKELRS